MITKIDISPSLKKTIALEQRVIADSGTLVDRNNTVNSIPYVLLKNRPSIVVTPSAFKEALLYSIVGNTSNTDLTVSRASTRTRVNENGLIEAVPINVPAIDWSSGKPAISIEPQRTNFVTNSEEFDSTPYTRLNLTVVPGQIAPTGGLIATELVEDNTLSIKQIHSTSFAGFVANIPRRYSVFIKKTNKQYVQVGSWRATTIWTAFLINLDDLTFIESPLNALSQVSNLLIEPYQNDFYRLSFNSTRNTNGNLNIYISFTNESTFSSGDYGLHPYLGTNDSMGIIFGVQLEDSLKATSYIPTTGTTVTRLADVITSPVQVFDILKGTLISKFKIDKGSAAERFVVNLTSNTNADYIGITVDLADIRVKFLHRASNTTNTTATASNLGFGNFIAAASWISGQQVLVVKKDNNAPIVVNTSHVLVNPIGIDRFTLGHRLAGNGLLEENIELGTYCPDNLSEQDLIDIVNNL
jgi:hypothetical protein